MELAITQPAVAKAANVSYQQVQKYERAASGVRASTLVKVATALHVNPGYFLDDAPGAHGAPAVDGWADAQQIIATVPGALDLLRDFADMKPAVRIIAASTVAVMSGRADEAT